MIRPTGYRWQKLGENRDGSPIIGPVASQWLITLFGIPLWIKRQPPSEPSN
jgi:hypothetical protein